MFDLATIQAANRPVVNLKGRLAVGYYRLAAFERWAQTAVDGRGLPLRPVEAATLATKARNRRIVLLASALQVDLKVAEGIVTLRDSLGLQTGSVSR